MGISQAEKDILFGTGVVERRKEERRKDRETAKNWKGMERRVCDRRGNGCARRPAVTAKTFPQSKYRWINV